MSGERGLKESDGQQSLEENVPGSKLGGTIYNPASNGLDGDNLHIQSCYRASERFWFDLLSTETKNKTKIINLRDIK